MDLCCFLFWGGWWRFKATYLGGRAVGLWGETKPHWELFVFLLRLKTTEMYLPHRNCGFPGEVPQRKDTRMGLLLFFEGPHQSCFGFSCWGRHECPGDLLLGVSCFERPPTQKEVAQRFDCWFRFTGKKRYPLKKTDPYGLAVFAGTPRPPPPPLPQKKAAVCLWSLNTTPQNQRFPIWFPNKLWFAFGFQNPQKGTLKKV